MAYLSQKINKKVSGLIPELKKGGVYYKPDSHGINTVMVGNMPYRMAESGSPSLIGSVHGHVLELNRTSSDNLQKLSSSSWHQISGDMTAFVRVRRTGATSNYYCFLSGSGTGDGVAANNTLYYIGTTNAGVLRFFWESATGTNHEAVSSTAYGGALDEWITFGFRRTGTTVRFYQNGVQLGTDSTQAAAANDGSASQFAIGAEIGTTGADCNFDISDAIMVPKSLDDALCRKLTRDIDLAYQRKILTAVKTIIPDTTAPVLSAPTGAATGTTTASGTVTTDELNGTLYYYASTNSTESAATIISSGSSQTVS